MSWHFSQGAEVESWEGKSLDGAPDALLRLMPSSADGSSIASAMDALIPSRSGTTSEPSMESHGAEPSTSSPAGSRAKTSARRAQGTESTANARDYGSINRGLFARWNPATSSWKTPQCSLLADLDEFSETWPRWGMMRTGECSELTTPSSITAIRACIMSEKGSGSWPTLRASDGERGGRGDLIQALRGNPNSHYRMPTLCAADGEKGGRGDLYARLNNSGRQRMPTLTVCGNYNRKGSSPNAGDGLWTAIKKLPTLTASDGSGGPGHGSKMQGGESLRTAIRAQEKDGGPLNPEWCEWYMGFPIGWTEQGGSAIANFRQWCRSFGAFSLK